MVIFAKEYFPIILFCFLLLIFLSWSTSLTYSLQVRSSTYTLKTAHIWAIFLHCVKVSSSNHFYDVQI
jgi:lipopolysaccharide export LptBFGC system permease protein LptF